MIIVSSICLLASCSGDPKTAANNSGSSDPVAGEKGLSLITNLEGFDTPSSKNIGSLDAPLIEGVLLKFHADGLYNEDSFFKNLYDTSNHSFANPYAFYLEYLTVKGVNGDGMTFNYVLYVPEIIRTAYKNGGGRNPNSGNAFWWYMSKYYGTSVDFIRNNWEPVLAHLLINRIGLLTPKAEDVTGSWKATWIDSVNVSYNNVSIKNNIANWYYEAGENRDSGLDPERILYFPEGKFYQKSEKSNVTKQIFLPTELSNVYFAGSGVSNYVMALLWYFEVYYHTDNDTVLNAYKNGTFGTLLDNCYTEYGYATPKGTDVMRVETLHEVTRAAVNTNYKLGEVHFYDSDILIYENEPVYNKELVYYNIENDKINFFVPVGYIEQMKQAYADHSREFSYSGDLVWFFGDWYCGIPYNSDHIVDEQIINKLLNYSVSKTLSQND